MRPVFLFFLLVAILPTASGLHAQVPTLPPGTSSPDADSSQMAPPDSTSAQAAALVSKAEDAIVREDYGKALPLLNDALNKEPAGSKQSARALYDRGYVEAQQKQFDAAAADFRKANAANPKQFESHAELGRLLAQEGQWKEAQHELEQAVALPPASGDPRQAVASIARTLARVDAELHDPAAASDALIAALKLTPEQPADTLLAAQLAEEQGNRTGAEAEYKKALAADPTSIDAMEGLARVLIHEGKFSDAAPILQQALQREPNDPTLLAQSATALAGEGKNQDAITELEMLHQQNPNQPAVTRMLADLYSGAGKSAQAAPLYQQLLTADPNNPDLLTAAGENQIRQRQWASAVETLQHSLNLQPTQQDAWGSLAFAASEDHQYPLVLHALDQRAQYAADGPATLFLRATALDHLHRTKEAVAAYRQFLTESQGKFQDEEWQTRQRLNALAKSH